MVTMALVAMSALQASANWFDLSFVDENTQVEELLYNVDIH